MDRLTLPSPAADLWSRIGPELQRILQYLPNPPSRYMIGGGTVLAARWNHRTSTDVDLTIPGGSGMNALRHDADADVRGRMMKLGAAHAMLASHHHRIEFRQGIIEITETDPRPSRGHTTVECGRCAVDALSTTQILRGKLERSLRHEPPARDLFDVAAAEIEDPGRLRQAVNMLAPEHQRQVRAHWQNAEHRIRAEAVHDIHVIGPEYRDLRDDLTRRVLVVLRNTRYLKTTISRSGDDVRIATTSRTRTDTHRTTPDQLEATLQATGLEAYFENQPPGPTTIAERIRKALSQPAESPTILTSVEPA